MCDTQIMSSQPRSRPAALGVEIAARLREALARRQVTQAELGSRVSISTSQISLYLRGKRSMSLDEFNNICMALGLSADEIFSQAFLLTGDQRETAGMAPGGTQPHRMIGEGS